MRAKSASTSRRKRHEERGIPMKTTGFLRRHSPTVLTWIGAAGTVATGIFAAINTPDAMARLEKARGEKTGELGKMEIVRIAAPAYLPAMAVCASTLLCIFGANLLNQRKQATMASAYAMLSTLYREYRGKVIEIFGEDGDYRVARAVAQDHEPGDDAPPWDACGLYYEEHLGRFFERTPQEVYDAEYHLNRNFAMRGYANLNEFYEFLGIPATEPGEKLGWSLGAGEEFYGYSWVDFVHRSFCTDDGLECIAIDMPFVPTADYMDF